MSLEEPKPSEIDTHYALAKRYAEEGEFEKCDWHITEARRATSRWIFGEPQEAP